MEAHLSNSEFKMQNADNVHSLLPLSEFCILNYKDHLKREGTVPRSRAAGRPPDDVAWTAARTMASESASAASAPIVVTSACPCHVAVASENTVSPSPVVWEGDTALDRPSSAISATRLISDFVRRAFVATIASVVLPPGRGALREGSGDRSSTRASASVLAVGGSHARDDRAG